MKKSVEVKGISISVKKANTADYISLTDIAKYKSDEPNDVIKNWLRSKDTIEFLGLWEKINNPDFKPVEFDGFRNEAGMSQQDRLVNLNRVAIEQMKILTSQKMLGGLKHLERGESDE